MIFVSIGCMCVISLEARHHAALNGEGEVYA